MIEGPPSSGERTPHPLPAGTVLRADPSLRTRDHGRILMGGSPLRFLRLSDTGARVVQSWIAGQPTGPGVSSGRLARRLVDGSMLHPEPSPGAPPGDITIVVPVKDDPVGLARTIGSLGGKAPVIIVDDGSDEPVAPVAQRGSDGSGGSTTVIRRPSAGGPAAARAAGLAAVDTPLVLFVDAGVTVNPSVIEGLARWFADPEVVAAAPRIATSAGSDIITRYEQSASPLDMGSVAGAVAPGRAVAYVPTACLMVRRASIEDVGGFDTNLRYGEDVDLVWRLGRVGTVRYDPALVVEHPARTTLRALARQRFGYGSSAGPLAARHGRDLAPVRMSTWSVAVLAAALTGRPLTALGLVGWTWVAFAPKLARLVPDHRTEAALLTVRGHAWAARSLADASVRVWWPIPVIAALIGWRTPLKLAWAFATLRRFTGASGDPVTRARSAGIATVDDLAYGTGVLVGAVRARAWGAVLPRIANWPND